MVWFIDYFFLPLKSSRETGTNNWPSSSCAGVPARWRGFRDASAPPVRELRRITGSRYTAVKSAAAREELSPSRWRGALPVVPAVLRERRAEHRTISNRSRTPLLRQTVC